MPTSLSKDAQIARCLGSGILIALLFSTGLAFAHNIDTTSTITVNPNPVQDPNPVAITGNTQCSGSQHTCPTPPLDGKGKIEECMAAGVGVPSSECGAGGSGAWVGLNGAGIQPAANGDYALSPPFDTTGLGGSTIGFRSMYVTGGGGHAPETSRSPSVDLVINQASPCEGDLQIVADLASGQGEPAPGSTHTWAFRIKIKACKDLTDVSAQGGTNGWTEYAGVTPSGGTVTIRKQNKKTTILRWMIGDMTANQEVSLLVYVSGTVSASCGSVQNLNGAWSATYTVDGATMKSDYTTKINVFVTCL